MKFYFCIFTLLLYQAFLVIDAKECDETLKYEETQPPDPIIKPWRRMNSILSPSGKQHPLSTRCKLKSAACDCCPYRNGVCCSDEKHCCPTNFTCDSQQGICKKKKKSIKLTNSLKFKGFASASLRTVECPGGKEECPDRTTCCKLPSGKHACCPHPEAVCCADGKHCCSHVYRCNSSSGTCVKQTETVRFLNTTASVRKLNIICPGGKDGCLDGDTCCKSASGGYGCCPEPNAVCCSNGKNCCPQGYTCDLAKCACRKTSPSYKLASKIRAMKEDGRSAMLN